MQRKHTLIHKIFTNPVLNGVTGIFGIFLSVYFYFKSLKEPLPAYAVIADAVITNSTNNNNIRIFYKNKRVYNVRLMTLTIWDAGDGIIDKSDFIDDELIRIQPSTNVNLLDCKILKKSRSDLNFELDSNAFKRNLLKLRILGNEVLEAKDGASIQVLYSSVSSTSWQVKARVKGIPEGFCLFDFESNVFYNFEKNHKTILSIILMIPGLYGAVIMVINYRNNNYINRRHLIIIVLYWISILIYAFLPELSYNDVIPQSLKI